MTSRDATMSASVDTSLLTVAKGRKWGSLPGAANPNWRGGRPQLTCESCGLPFLGRQYRKSRFCSRKCAGRAQSKLVGPANPKWKRRSVSCRHCGLAFVVAARYRRRRYCSAQCYGESQRRVWYGASDSQKRCKALRKAAAGRWPLTPRERNEIKAEFNWRCPACGRPEPEIILTIDHAVPLVKGGTHDRANLQALCRSCNIRKRGNVAHYEPLPPIDSIITPERS